MVEMWEQWPRQKSSQFVKFAKFVVALLVFVRAMLPHGVRAARSDPSRCDGLLSRLIRAEASASSLSSVWAFDKCKPGLQMRV
jgi:hypothetical protein